MNTTNDAAERAYLDHSARTQDAWSFYAAIKRRGRGTDSRTQRRLRNLAESVYRRSRDEAFNRLYWDLLRAKRAADGLSVAEEDC